MALKAVYLSHELLVAAQFGLDGLQRGVVVAIFCSKKLGNIIFGQDIVQSVQGIPQAQRFRHECPNVKNVVPTVVYLSPFPLLITYRYTIETRLKELQALWI